MIGKNVVATVVLLSAMAGSGNASAAVITFGTSVVDPLSQAGTQTEGGFNYTASGDGWELQTVFAASGAALATFFNGDPSKVNDQVNVVRNGGGRFTFDSVEWRNPDVSAPVDDIVFEGFLNNALVASLDLSDFSSSFVTAVGFGGPIDLLRVRVTQAGLPSIATRVLDNLSVTPTASVAVSAPSSVALLGLGLAGLALSRRKRC